MEETDEALVEAYRNGDASALERLFGRHVRALFAYVRRLSGSAEEAEDLAQEAIVRAWRKLHQFDARQRFKPWLFSIARNATFDWLRTSRPARFSELDDNSAFEESLVDPEPLPDELAARSDLGAVLDRALEDLPPAQRSVVLLRAEGFTFDEIARLSRTPLNTVKSSYRRALILLRKRLG